MKTSLIVCWIIVATALIFSLALYRQMPERIDSHWDAQGRVNGTMSRFWGMFLVPVVMVGLTLLMIFLPKIDPLNPNFTGFRSTYNTFIVAFNLFLLLIHTYMVLWNLGTIQFKPNVIISAATGLLFLNAGVLLKKARRNWFAGIRTPWTLSSETVWDKTHQLGSYLFKGAGVLIFLSILIPAFSVQIILIASLGVSIISTVYSYIVYLQEQNTGGTC
jgi:uncharacterized membrane protein